jgi:hypothetical protein
MPRPKKSNGAVTTAKRGPTGVHAPFFRDVFTSNPKLLKSRSNEQVRSIWLAANPGKQEMPPNVVAAMSAVKSNMRSKARTRRTKDEIASELAVGRTKEESLDTGLEKLEELIDESIQFARTLDKKLRLERVVEALLKARRRVVWKLGEDEE